MDDHVERVLIDRDRIAARVDELARQIAEDYKRGSGSEQPEVTVLAVLTGSLIFLADLIRRMPIMLRIRLITVSSYPGTATTSQGVTLMGQLPADLAGQHVLVVDDILDSGNTIRFVRGLLEERHPASVRTCMLLRKQRESDMSEHADYIGFDIPDEFVVGYGLDYDGLYRNVPDLVTLKPQFIRSAD